MNGGWVLGPLLALIYLNDLEGSTENELFFFADDTFYSRPIHTARQKLSLSREIWTKSCTSVRNGQLPSTPQKQHSKTLRESMTKTSPWLKFGSDLIPIVSNHKHLGLHMSSSDLKFHVHTKHLTRKANAALGPLYSVAANIPRQTLKRLYVTYVIPIFDYADWCWRSVLWTFDSCWFFKVLEQASHKKFMSERAPLDISGGSADPSDLPGCATDWSYF